MFGINPFASQRWAADAIAYFDTTDTSFVWEGATVQGTYSHTFTLSDGQVAWSTLFSWGINSDIPLLNIMDCGAGNAGDICTGIGAPMQTPLFPGGEFAFNEVVSAISIPATLWLFAVV